MNVMTALRPGEDSKLQAHHRDQLAAVYVRQATMQQIERHQESTRLQYGLVDHAQALGWAQSQILVIDDDLGKSGASAEGRPGFQRLVTEVSLDYVGIVLGIEMSQAYEEMVDLLRTLERIALAAKAHDEGRARPPQEAFAALDKRLSRHRCYGDNTGA